MLERVHISTASKTSGKAWKTSALNFICFLIISRLTNRRTRMGQTWNISVNLITDQLFNKCMYIVTEANKSICVYLICMNILFVWLLHMHCELWLISYLNLWTAFEFITGTYIVLYALYMYNWIYIQTVLNNKHIKMM